MSVFILKIAFDVDFVDEVLGDFWYGFAMALAQRFLGVALGMTEAVVVLICVAGRPELPATAAGGSCAVPYKVRFIWRWSHPANFLASGR